MLGASAAPGLDHGLAANPMFILALTLAAFLTATLSGLAGLGGGTILIGLFFALGLPPSEAVPLFAAIQLISNTSRTVAYARHVHWRAAGWFLLAAVPTTAAIAPFVVGADPDLIGLLLGLLILASLAPAADAKPLPPVPAFVVAGFLNGSLGLFVGATGLFVGRLFLRPEWDKRTTIGTLALTQTLGHGLRVAAFGLLGLSAFASPERLIPLALAVIAGTWAGKQLNQHLSQRQFELGFKALLGVLSCKLIWDGGGALALW